MTRRILLRTLVVSLAFVAATAIGWWALPVSAAAFGAATWRDRAGSIVAGVAAMVAWGVILVYDAWFGPVARVASTLGGVLQIRPFAAYVLTLAFAGLTAVCAAIVARSIARVIVRTPAERPAS